MMDLNKNKSGFSLIETIVYLAIVGILLTATVTFHLTLGGTADKMSSNILASRNRRVAMGTIDYLVKNSDGLLKDTTGDCSDFTSSPPSLALYFEDDGYLPGTCVASGGGVRISVANKQVVMTCYPSMNGNGHYQNCDTTVYPAVNKYYLSSSDVAVLNSSLSFSTSTVTSTANNFAGINTNLSVGTHSNNQIRLTATSTATSTVVLRNSQPSGLISWWTSWSAPKTWLDSQGNNDLTCWNVPVQVSGLINGSDEAVDFESTSAQYCNASNGASMDFNNAFTISAWVKEESSGSEMAIVNKSGWTPQTGYKFSIHSGIPRLRIYDGNSYTDYVSSYTLTNATTYNVIVSYDLDNDEIIHYVYEKAVGQKATTTVNSLRTLVNYNGDLLFSSSNNFDGVIDDVKLYNRVLTPEEVWAIQSQGAS
jgi:prepilin-type N-terminal cleavage/methylation domain-containing protein